MTSVHAGDGDVYSRPAKTPDKDRAPVDGNVHYRTQGTLFVRKDSDGSYRAIQSVMCCASLSHARVLWLVLFEHVNQYTGVASPCLETLAQWMQHSTTRRVRLWLHELSAAGLIERSETPRGWRLRDADGNPVLGRAQRVAAASDRPVPSGDRSAPKSDRPVPKSDRGVHQQRITEEENCWRASETGTSPRDRDRADPAASPPTTPKASPDPDPQKQKQKQKVDDFAFAELTAWRDGERSPLLALVRTTARSTLDDTTLELAIATCIERLQEQKRRVTPARVASYIRQGEVWARAKRSTASTSTSTQTAPVEPTTVTPRSERDRAAELARAAEAKRAEEALQASSGVPAWFSAANRTGGFSRPPEPARSPILEVSGVHWDPDAVGGAP